MVWHNYIKNIGITMTNQPRDSRIVHLFQKSIGDTLVQDIRTVIPDFDMQDWQKILTFFNSNGLLPRRGTKNFPFNLDPVYYNREMPVYDPGFALSFENVTDLRYNQLLAHYSDRPWIVSWSGGIDSTTVMCAIIKNASKHQLKNLKIGMTAGSIFENQEFFDQEINGRFTLVDVSTREFLPMIDSHYVITGEPNDLLMGGINLMNAGNNGLDITKPWQDNSDLLYYLENKLGISAARWIYRLMGDNLAGLTNTDPPVVSVNDWFWWMNFCCKWAATTNEIQGIASAKYQK